MFTAFQTFVMKMPKFIQNLQTINPPPPTQSTTKITQCSENENTSNQIHLIKPIWVTVQV